MESTPVEIYCVDNLSFLYRDATHLFSVVCHRKPNQVFGQKRTTQLNESLGTYDDDNDGSIKGSQLAVSV